MKYNEVVNKAFMFVVCFKEKLFGEESKPVQKVWRVSPESHRHNAWRLALFWDQILYNRHYIYHVDIIITLTLLWYSHATTDSKELSETYQFAATLPQTFHFSKGTLLNSILSDSIIILSNNPIILDFIPYFPSHHGR